MNTYCIIVYLLFISGNLASFVNNNNKPFPPDFLWGVSNSAYQFEGAWNQDGKSPNVWDFLLHKNPNFTVDGKNNSVSTNSYNMIEKEIKLIKFLRVKMFRMSVAWTRILPLGNEGKPNKKAISHYKYFFQRLKENNITPLVTLHHFDLPQKLANYGGFLNANLTEWFSKYARICFENFGEDVKHWMTFNEPYIWCLGAYSAGFLAPATINPGIWEYTCGHNLLKAHAAVWHMYDKEFRSIQNGTISITLASDWYAPMTKSEDDIKSAERQMQFRLGWFAHPIYHGNYPSIMIKNIAKLSIEEGRNSSRLPSFTKKEIQFIKGTNDIFLLNFYKTYLSNSTVTASMKTPGLQNDIRASTSDSIPNGAWGIRSLISWIRKNYHDPSIWITENGIESTNSSLDDYFRVNYLKDVLNNVRDSIYIDKSNILGYTVWSLSDSFEGIHGYSSKMGLAYVDFNSENKTRIPRASAYFYSKVCQTGCIYDNCTTLKSLD